MEKWILDQWGSFGRVDTVVCLEGNGEWNIEKYIR